MVKLEIKERPGEDRVLLMRADERDVNYHCHRRLLQKHLREFDRFPYGRLSSFIRPHLCLGNEYLIPCLLGARHRTLRQNHRNEKDTAT